jgi:hypothetical protein
MPVLVQGLHRVAEEYFGQALPAVIRVSEKFCNESGFRPVLSQGAFCRDDGGGNAAFGITGQLGSLGDECPSRTVKDRIDA